MGRIYRNILWFGLAAVMVFAPLAKGAVQIWSITPIEMVVLSLVFLWLWRVKKLRKTAIDIPIWLFVGLAAVSCGFSIYKYASLMEMLRLLMYVGVFYLVVNNFDRRMGLRIASLIIIMGAGMSLFGLGQYFLGLEHSWWNPNIFLASTYVNHNHFAGYLELAIPLAIGLTIGLKSEILPRFKLQGFKLALITAIIIMFLAFVFSQSRGAWVSLTISLIVMNVVLVKRKVLKKESLIILLLFIVLGLAYVYGGYDAVAERLRTVDKFNAEGFFETRQKIWQGSINMIEDNPIVGTGIGTFVWGLPHYRPEGLNVRAHNVYNDYLHMMAEMGLLALPLMLWMIWVVVAIGFRWQDREGLDKGWVKDDKGLDRLKKQRRFRLMEGVLLGGAVGILSLALHGLVDFNFHITANMLVVAAVAGIIVRRRSKEGEKGLKRC